MDPITIGFIGVGALVLLVVIGLPVAFAAAIVGIGGLMVMRNVDTAIGLAGIVPYASSASYSLSVMPLFIAIGFLALHAGITRGAFESARLWVGRLPGGLATATIFASAGFGAVSGASTATAAVFTKLAVPEMEQRGYDKALATGVVAVGGTLAALIPPSAILVIYGIIVDTSIGRLLIAGLIPGLLSAIVYMGVITFVVKRNPELAPRMDPVPMLTKIRSLSKVWGILAVIGIILGGVYFGWMTPTESASIGTAIVLGLALTRRMSFAEFKDGLLDTIKTTAMIFLVIWGVMIFVRFLAFTGMPDAVTHWLVEMNLPPIVVVIFVIILYLLLGMVLDGLGMMILTLPVIYPAMMALGFDPVWFGVIVVKMIEIGLVTPPVGLNCYVVNGVRPDIPLETIFRGVLPFLVGEIIIMTLLIAFPEIVLFLPNTMFN
ncbi:MAG: TRAP transporter large permease [Rhodobiaceae bacterium]|nr:TRAP transporter large permease [Rhodobiaceae bacterium]MCC0054747.1 TRAP transporter large permease [Rhodobiaceae bacterium]